MTELDKTELEAASTINDCVCKHVGYCDGSCQPSSPETGIKSCPFCGGQATREELTDEDNFGGSVICCTQCGASSPVHFDRKENLIDSWNRLASTTSKGVTEEQTPRNGLVASLLERLKLKYVANCKCGSCQCVPVDLICDAAAKISEFEASEASRGVDAPASQEEAVTRDEDNMPERIWAGDFNASGFGHCVAGPQGGLYAEYVRADLASPSPAPAGEPGIKALEWEEEPNEPGWWTATVEPLRLFYEARVNSRGETRAILPGEVWKPFDGNIDAAKAAAQADYERRIRSALAPTPVSAPVGKSKVRYSRVFGNDRMEMGRSLPIELYRIGDTILVWANEGDLCFYGQEFARSPAVEGK